MYELIKVVGKALDIQIAKGRIHSVEELDIFVHGYLYGILSHGSIQEEKIDATCKQFVDKLKSHLIVKFYIGYPQVGNFPHPGKYAVVNALSKHDALTILRAFHPEIVRDVEDGCLLYDEKSWMEVAGFFPENPSEIMGGEV